MGFRGSGVQIPALRQRKGATSVALFVCHPETFLLGTYTRSTPWCSLCIHCGSGVLPVLDCPWRDPFGENPRAPTKTEGSSSRGDPFCVMAVRASVSPHQYRILPRPNFAFLLSTPVSTVLPSFCSQQPDWNPVILQLAIGRVPSGGTGRHIPEGCIRPISDLPQFWKCHFSMTPENTWFSQLNLTSGKRVSIFGPKTRTMASPAIEPVVWTPLLFLRYRALFNDSLAMSTHVRRV